MDTATQAHLTTLRELLEYRLAELRAEVHAAQMSQREAPPPGAGEVSDRKDEASARQAGAVDVAQEERDVDELARVEAALARLERGAYGDCADCGEPISLQRLLVQPAALRCAACQSAFEQAARARL